MGSILVLCLSMVLHSGTSVIAPWPNLTGVMSWGSSYSHEPSPYLVMLVLFLISIPVGISFSILHILSWFTILFMFTMLVLLFLLWASGGRYCDSLWTVHILSGSLKVVDALLVAGADSFVAHVNNVSPLHPLVLTIYMQDKEWVAKIASQLIAAQALSLTADEYRFTIFHCIVFRGKTKIVVSLLEHDPNAKKILNGPAWYMNELMFPIVSTIMAGDYATLSFLLTHGAKLSYLLEDVSRAEEKGQYALYALYCNIYECYAE